jgi:hypothetical protein
MVGASPGIRGPAANSLPKFSDETFGTEPFDPIDLEFYRRQWSQTHHVRFEYDS